METDNLIVSDTVKIYFETHGSGTPILLIAGLASDSQSWGPLVQALARDFLVITPDNRACGRSTQDAVDVSIPIMADDCIALLDHLGIEAAYVLGHSMGGFIALECGLRYPERVSGLILAGTAPRCQDRNSSLFRDWADALAAGIDKGEWFRGLFPWLFTGSFLQDVQAVDNAVRYAVDYPFPQSPAAFRKQVEALATFDCTGQIATINLPSLVLHGREDRLFLAEESMSCFSAICAAHLVVIENAAHSLHLEQPEACVEAVRGFLRLKEKDIL